MSRVGSNPTQMMNIGDIREMSFKTVLDTVLKPAGVKVGGFPEEIFLNLLEDEKEKWSCNICYLVVNDCRQCINKHLFCNTCVFAWSLTFGENSRRCPVCRVDQLTYAENKEVKRLVGEKRVSCPHEDCTFRAPLKILLMHSHGKTLYDNGNLDLETLRPSPPRAASNICLLLMPRLSLLAEDGGEGDVPMQRAQNLRNQLLQGRLMIQQMMMLLHMEMQLRERASTSFSEPIPDSSEARLQRLDEVLALNIQISDIGAMLSSLVDTPLNLLRETQQTPTAETGDIAEGPSFLRTGGARARQRSLPRNDGRSSNSPSRMLSSDPFSVNAIGSNSNESRSPRNGVQAERRSLTNRQEFISGLNSTVDRDDIVGSSTDRPLLSVTVQSRPRLLPPRERVAGPLRSSSDTSSALNGTGELNSDGVRGGGSSLFGISSRPFQPVEASSSSHSNLVSEAHRQLPIRSSNASISTQSQNRGNTERALLTNRREFSPRVPLENSSLDRDESSDVTGGPNGRHSNASFLLHLRMRTQQTQVDEPAQGAAEVQPNRQLSSRVVNGVQGGSTSTPSQDFIRARNSSANSSRQTEANNRSRSDNAVSTSRERTPSISLENQLEGERPQVADPGHFVLESPRAQERLLARSSVVESTLGIDQTQISAPVEVTTSRIDQKIVARPTLRAKRSIQSLDSSANGRSLSRVAANEGSISRRAPRFADERAKLPTMQLSRPTLRDGNRGSNTGNALPLMKQKSSELPLKGEGQTKSFSGNSNQSLRSEQSRDRERGHCQWNKNTQRRPANTSGNLLRARRLSEIREDIMKNCKTQQRD